MPSKSSRARRNGNRCMVCGAHGPNVHLIATRALRASVATQLRDEHPDKFSEDSWVCRDDLNRARLGYVLSALRKERGELSAVEAEIAAEAVRHSTIAEDLEASFRARATLGNRVADAMAHIGGSWPFVLAFLTGLLAWIVVNAILGLRAFDRYPYILLNLVLSCLAAMQAPVIMMSQNRAAARDRAQADQDFRINLKAEMEVASLHEKLDHLLHTQWDRLIEMQEVQLEMLTELGKQ